MKKEEQSTELEKELKPTTNRIIVNILENPYLPKVKIEGYIDIKKQDPKNPMPKDSIFFGKVLEIGPEAKDIKVGDEVFFSEYAGIKVPFYDNGFVVIRDVEVICTVRDGEDK